MKTGVFTINFVRHQALSLDNQNWLHQIYVVWLGLNLLIMVVFTLFAWQNYSQQLIEKKVYESKFSNAEELRRLKSDVEKVGQKATVNLSRLKAVLAARNSQLRMADKLAVLAKTLPQRTWVSHVEADRVSHILKVDAMCWIKPDSSGSVTADDWIHTLRSDADFSRGLKNIQMTQSLQKKQGEVELRSFSFTVEWA